MRRLLLVAAVAALVVTPACKAWTWPASGGVLQPFTFDPNHPYDGGQHRGVDVGASAGESVLAPAGGQVTFAGTVPGSGLSVTIATADGYAVTLTHLGSIGVAKGDAVAEGAAVGTVGPSGDAEVQSPYVHLGIRRASDEQGYVDPLSLLPARSAPSPPVPAPSSDPAPAVSPAPSPAVAAPPATAAPAPTPVAAPAPAPSVEAPPPVPTAPAVSPIGVPAPARAAATLAPSAGVSAPEPPGGAGLTLAGRVRSPGRQVTARHVVSVVAEPRVHLRMPTTGQKPPATAVTRLVHRAMRTRARQRVPRPALRAPAPRQPVARHVSRRAAEPMPVVSPAAVRTGGRVAVPARLGLARGPVVPGARRRGRRSGREAGRANARPYHGQGCAST